VLERASVMSASEVLDEADLALPALSPSPAAAAVAEAVDEDDLDLRRATATLERRLIEKALARSSGNRAEAARLLGIGRPNLYAKMRELGLS
jgi:two-component system nitrogen regulation response regulator GlnG/two-component system response regulator AtoC